MAVLDAEDEAGQAFVSHAKDCETFASANPDAYKWRVVALAALGLLFPSAVLLALVAVFAAGAGIYGAGDYDGGSWVIGILGVALTVLLAIAGRAMWPQFGAPDGKRLRRADAPEFFAFIDDLRGKAGNPKVHRVYVTGGRKSVV